MRKKSGGKHGRIDAIYRVSCSNCPGTDHVEGYSDRDKAKQAFERLGWKRLSGRSWTCPTCQSLLANEGEST